LRDGITNLASKFSFIREVRAEGLMIGIELTVEGAPFVNEAMHRGLLINCTHDFTLRLLPPFIIKRAQVREFLRLLELVLTTAPQKASAPDSARSADTKRVAHATAR
jgi:acetylornithine/succinyldiaminopimelate/putrescine aminotransferase